MISTQYTNNNTSQRNMNLILVYLGILWVTMYSVPKPSCKIYIVTLLKGLRFFFFFIKLNLGCLSRGYRVLNMIINNK
jgi:hypothetical protein